MFFTYFKQKSIYSSLFSTILLGLVIGFNSSKYRPAFASPKKEQAEDIELTNSEQEIDYKKSSKYFGIGIGYALKGKHAQAIDNFKIPV